MLERVVDAPAPPQPRHRSNGRSAVDGKGSRIGARVETRLVEEQRAHSDPAPRGVRGDGGGDACACGRPRHMDSRRVQCQRRRATRVADVFERGGTVERCRRKRVLGSEAVLDAEPRNLGRLGHHRGQLGGKRGTMRIARRRERVPSAVEPQNHWKRRVAAARWMVQSRLESGAVGARHLEQREPPLGQGGIMQHTISVIHLSSELKQ
mmetsp:Transcript_31882/g.101975  ORF Transcript_31882/g.101975 Transcript_31882/m.101975 type:complete len:208 (-) Transcript_31882:203-826(-)